MLENPTEAVNELSFFECIDSVMENSKVQHAPLLLLSCSFDQLPVISRNSVLKELTVMVCISQSIYISFTCEI